MRASSRWEGLGGTPQHPRCGASYLGSWFWLCLLPAETLGKSQELSEPSAPPVNGVLPGPHLLGLQGWDLRVAQIGESTKTTHVWQGQGQSPSKWGLRAQGPPTPGATRLPAFSLDKETKAWGRPGLEKWETWAKSSLLIKPHQV